MIALYYVGLQRQQQLFGYFALLLQSDQQLTYLVELIVHTQSQLQGLFELFEFSRGRLGPEQVIVGLDELIIEIVIERQQQRQFLIIWHHFLSPLAILDG